MNYLNYGDYKTDNSYKPKSSIDNLNHICEIKRNKVEYLSYDKNQGLFINNFNIRKVNRTTIYNKYDNSKINNDIKSIF